MDERFRALADPTRRRILSMVWSDEVSAGMIARAFNISRPGVSQHIRVLLDAGLLTVRSEGTRRLYRADKGSLAAVRAVVDGYWGERLVRLKDIAERTTGNGGTEDDV